MYDENEDKNRQYNSVHIHTNKVIEENITSEKDLASLNHTCLENNQISRIIQCDMIEVHREQASEFQVNLLDRYLE